MTIPRQRDASERAAPSRPLNPMDILPPAEVARLVAAAAVRKAGMALLPMFMLAVLAGAFIAFGAMVFTVTVTDSGLGLGPTRILGGLAFSLGLILVIIGGAELFTGNNLMVTAWAEGEISGAALLRNWGVVYLGNLAGALAMVVCLHLAGGLDGANAAIGETAARIAAAKAALPPLQAFMRGVLCNILVCLAVWMSFAAHSAAGKVLVMLFPISAFVALGFEHSVANMYLLPIGALRPGSTLEPWEIVGNLVPVTLGNIVGGGGLVALVYWLIYLRDRPEPDSASD